MNGGKSKGKMYTKGKGKKGKSKHKVAYNFDYFVNVSQYEDISNEKYLEESIYVMSLHDDRTVSTQGVHMVIVDTGATELVCGANAMTRIYESADLRGVTCRPTNIPVWKWFVTKGNLTSGPDHECPGQVEFLHLDGEVENTPPLLGGREMKERKAIVAYCGSYFAHRDPTLLIEILVALSWQMIFVIYVVDMWPTM